MEALGATTSRVWSRRQALRTMTAAEVQTQVRRGAWQRPWPGVYADAGEPLDATQRAVAAVLASGGADRDGPPRSGRRRGLRAIACGRTAARVHGFVLVDDHDPATGAEDELVDEVIVTSSCPDLASKDHDGRRRLLRRYERVLAPGDVRFVPGGLHVTSRLRTVADCATSLSHAALVCLLDDALHRQLLDVDELQALLVTMTWRPGAVSLRRALAAADERAESPAETLTRLLLLPVLPGLVPQVRVLEGRRTVARLDLGDERLRLAVEADGKVGHAGEQMVAKDRQRDRSTDALGWRTERFTWFEIRRRPDHVRASALQAASQQAQRHGLPWP